MTDKILIVSITPYFLERGNVWFQENLGKILEQIIQTIIEKIGLLLPPSKQ